MAKINTALEIIDDLLSEHHISLRAVYEAAEKHEEDIKNIDRIFELKSEDDKKLCLGVLRLLAGEKAEEVCNYFCNKYLIENNLDDIFYAKNKVYIIAAFINNPSFLTMSINICGYIKTELTISAESKADIEQTAMEREIGPVDFYIDRIDLKTASTSDEILKNIWNRSLDEKNIKGELFIDASDYEGRGRVQFTFIFAEYTPAPPFYLTIRYKTISDNKEHKAELFRIAANDSENRELIIESRIYRGVSYGEGIKEIRIELSDGNGN